MSEEQNLNARDVMARLVELSGMSCTVDMTETEERIHLEVTPESEDDGRLLVGRQGTTLSAYQFIVNRMVNRGQRGRKRISVDVHGYAERRSEQLEALGQRIGNVARSAGMEIRVHGMNPADRRTVHLSLERVSGIRTFSEDEGIARRLVVVPRAPRRTDANLAEED